MVGVVEEHQRGSARRLCAAGGSEDDAGGDGHNERGGQQREPLHVSSFARRWRTTAAPARAKNASVSARKANQPIAASVPLLSGTPLAVNASAASARTIAIARCEPVLNICLSFRERCDSGAAAWGSRSTAPLRRRSARSRWGRLGRVRG